MSDIRKPAARDKMVIFHGAGAPSLAEASMSVGRSHVAGEPIDDFFNEAVMESFTSAVPFRQEGPDPRLKVVARCGRERVNRQIQGQSCDLTARQPVREGEDISAPYHDRGH